MATQRPHKKELKEDEKRMKLFLKKLQKLDRYLASLSDEERKVLQKLIQDER